jgi:hypothetical protein
MPGSTTSLFPDINVWVALTYEGHAHHRTAAMWFETLALTPDVSLVFPAPRLVPDHLLRSLTSLRPGGTTIWTVSAGSVIPNISLAAQCDNWAMPSRASIRQAAP